MYETLKAAVVAAGFKLPKQYKKSVVRKAVGRLRADYILKSPMGAYIELYIIKPNKRVPAGDVDAGQLLGWGY